MSNQGIGQAIDDAVSRLERDIVAATSALIQTPSVDPSYPGVDRAEHLGGEARANALVAKLYREAGATVELVEFDDGRPNALGRVEGGDQANGRSLILNGHIDVVPPGRAEDWHGTDPYSGRVSEGRIWGRGASDQKGALVCAAMAARALRMAGITLRGDLLLESVVGEEVGEHHLGTGGLIEAGYRADGAVVTEPTTPVSVDPYHPPSSLLVCPVSAGLLWLTVDVVGKRGHNNLRPHLVRAGGVGEAAGVNAIEKGLIIVQGLQELERQWGQKYSHPLFSPGHFTLHPGVISGGPHGADVPFFISEYCRIEYSILYPPFTPATTIRSEIEVFIDAISRTDPWLATHPATLTWRFDWPPYDLTPDHPLVETLVGARRQVLGEPQHQGLDPDPSVRAFDAVDDAMLFHRAGIPVVSCGPGGIQFAHAVNESVAISELVDATRLYALAATRWCGVVGSE